MPTLRLVLAFLLGLASLPALAEPLTWPPFDEAGSDRSFQTFRDRLLQAVRERDVEAVVAAAAEDIELSYGGDNGRDTFRLWLTGGGDTEPAFYWAYLERALAEGGRFENGIFIGPWSYWYEPPDTIDYYSAAVVAGKNVRLRAGPSTGDAVIRALSYEIVVQVPYDPDRETIVQDASGREWVNVDTTQGERGWIAQEFLRFLLDYRAGFEQRNGAWQMIFFVAGD